MSTQVKGTIWFWEQPGVFHTALEGVGPFYWVVLSDCTDHARCYDVYLEATSWDPQKLMHADLREAKAYVEQLVTGVIKPPLEAVR